MHDGDDVDEVFLVVTNSVCGHLELSLVGELDLDLFRFLLLVKISWGDIRDGWPNGQRALLALGVSEAIRQGLEVGTHSKLPEWSLQ
jgi:hypothetical protein